MLIEVGNDIVNLQVADSRLQDGDSRKTVLFQYWDHVDSSIYNEFVDRRTAMNYLPLYFGCVLGTIDHFCYTVVISLVE